MPEAMEDIVDSIESLLESAAEYGKTSYELVKLKTIEKTSDVVSSLIPHAVVFLILMSFLLFLNLGVAFWLGGILRNMFYGFFVVAAFYGIIGLVLHFFMHDRIKKKISGYIIKQALK
jgi:fatty acid desaturase